MKTHYEILGVNWKATEEEIQVAFHNLSKRYHPDTGVVPIAFKYTDAVDAYNALKTKSAREKYNRELIFTHRNCTNCKGNGYTFRQKGFTGRQLIPCKNCNSVGLVLKKGSLP